MDHYIVEFNRRKEQCKVMDYFVYLEKKEGLAKFNPFASANQLVIYLTDKGCYFLQVQGMGIFTDPVKLESDGHHQIAFEKNGRVVRSGIYGKLYSYIRKWNNGCCGSCEELAQRI